MDEDVEHDEFISIGNLEGLSEVIKRPLKMFGYPSEPYLKTINMEMAYIVRREMTGNVYSINNFIINYSLDTRVGCSGSPVLTRGPNG